MKKKVLITGSGQGLGFNLAKLFNKNGYDVIIHSRSKNKALNASRKINNCNFIFGDLSDEKKTKLIFSKLLQKIKRLDILICNAGNSKEKKKFNDSKSDWIKSFNNNFFSAYCIIKECSKNFKKIKSGKVICISSICGIEYIEGAPMTYSVSKNALINFVKIYSKHLSKFNIDINSISPGNIMFSGSVWEKKMKKNPRNIKKLIKDTVPANSFIKTENIFNVCKFLISNNSKMISGQNFIVDGGQLNRLYE